MNRYQPAQPRLVSGLAAMALSAITIGLLVVLPSKMEVDSRAYGLLAAANSATAVSCGRGTL